MSIPPDAIGHKNSGDIPASASLSLCLLLRVIARRIFFVFKAIVNRRFRAGSRCIRHTASPSHLCLFPEILSWVISLSAIISLCYYSSPLLFLPALFCARHLRWRVSPFFYSPASDAAEKSGEFSPPPFFLSIPRNYSASPSISVGFYPAFLSYLLSRYAIFLLPAKDGILPLRGAINHFKAGSRTTIV